MISDNLAFYWQPFNWSSSCSFFVTGHFQPVAVMVLVCFAAVVWEVFWVFTMMWMLLWHVWRDVNGKICTSSLEPFLHLFIKLPVATGWQHWIWVVLFTVRAEHNIHTHLQSRSPHSEYNICSVFNPALLKLFTRASRWLLGVIAPEILNAYDWIKTV